MRRSPRVEPRPDDQIRGEVDVFAATGITPGETRNGARYLRWGARTHTAAMSSEPRMVRFTDTIYALEPGAGTHGFQLQETKSI